MKIICYDFEIYRYDYLLGTLIIENGQETFFQTWDLKEIKQFYYDNHKNSIWVSHNGSHYDQPVYEQILKNQDPYVASKKIIRGELKFKANLDINEFDCMTIRRAPFSLKLTELIVGKNIHTTDVDFDLERELTEKEKRLTEEYNKDDLRQTFYNFQKFYPQFELRINIAKTFNLSIKDALRSTEAQLAAKVLGAKKDPSLKYNSLYPEIWPTLRIKNQKVLDWYLNQDYMQKNLTLNLCNCEIILGKGGIHGAQNKYYCEKLIYADVSGYYNRIMINLDLFPRTMDIDSKNRYIDMFYKQLEMKKDPSKKNARKAMKTILLSVFGAMNNEYGEFYDPYKFYLVTLSGQLYLIDLLEKLDGLVTGININTDGIMIVPLDWNNEDKIMNIINEWQKRTNFIMDIGYLTKLYQRDVNTYFAIEGDGEIHYKGDIVNYSISDKAYGSGQLFDCTNPPIIAKGCIDFFLYDIDPEETVEKNKTNLRMFQYPCKKGTFDYITEDSFVFFNNIRGKQISQLYHSREVKPLNRVFAKKLELKNGMKTYTILTKHKNSNGKHVKQKIANLPDSIFIYNEDITDAYEKLKDKIDWQYYVNRIYEKLAEFVQIEDEPKKENSGLQQLSFDL